MSFNSINSPMYLIDICSTQKNGRANNYNDEEKRREENTLLQRGRWQRSSRRLHCSQSLSCHLMTVPNSLSDCMDQLQSSNPFSPVFFRFASMPSLRRTNNLLNIDITYMRFLIKLS